MVGRSLSRTNSGSSMMSTLSGRQTSRHTYTGEDKGRAVNFCGGKYQGKSGWVNKSKKATKTRIYVIIDMGNGFLKTFVNKDNVATPRPPGDRRNFIEAVLDQHPDIEQMVDKFCQALAECEFDFLKPENRDLFQAIIFEKALLAQKNQSSKGNAARYRKVVHVIPEEETTTEQGS